MAFAPILLGLTPSLLYHATGAITFVGDEPGWDDDAAIYATLA